MNFKNKKFDTKGNHHADNALLLSNLVGMFSPELMRLVDDLILSILTINNNIDRVAVKKDLDVILNSVMSIFDTVTIFKNDFIENLNSQLIWAIQHELNKK